MPDLLPLDGLSVVEFAQGISGPYCGWLMACAGADVVKLEPPEGDSLRRLEPSAESGDSAAFVAINSGKRSVALRGDGTDGSVVEPLLAGADVVIVDSVGADADGWTVERVSRSISSTTVVCRTGTVPGNGPATELEVQAMSGLNRYLGESGARPLRMGADLGQVLAGTFLFQAALAALLERDTTGAGQTVETSALGALAAVGSVMIAALDDPDAWEGFHCLAAAYTRDYGVQTAGGPISFSSPRRSDDDWIALCQDLGADELAANPDYARDSDRTPRSKELNRDLSRFTKSLPRETVLEAAQRRGALAVPVQTYSEVFLHPQVEAIDALTVTGSGRRLAPPWRINGSRPHPRADVPELGRDTDTVSPPGNKS